MSNNTKILKNLGLQDMLISPDLSNFASWFSELIEENFLGEVEVVKANELKSASTFIDDSDSLDQRIEEIVGNAIRNVGDIEELQNELDDLKDAEEAVENMLATAKGTELRMNEELNRLNSEIQDSLSCIESLTRKCQDGAEMMEHLSMKNMDNRSNFLSSLSNQLSSPMHWCHLNYENYFVDSDNAALAIKLLFEKTLKFKDDLSFVDDEDDQLKKRTYDLFTLDSTFTKTASALYETESKLMHVATLSNTFLKPFEPMSYTLMSEQLERLTWQNEDIEENLENVDTAIKEKIAQLGYQEAKFCEGENNKEKLAAAEKRLELLKMCAASVSDHLLLSELLWLSLNIERQTIENILENVSSDHYENENEQCARNAEILTRMSSNSTVDHVEDEFAKQVAEMIADDIVDADGTGSDEELANPVAKYADGIHQFEMRLQNVVSDSYQIKIVDLLKDLNGISAHLNAFIGNGPTNKPNIWHLPVLAESEIYKGKFDLMFDLSRMLRHNFMEKYHQPSTNDELWKRRQLLWIWFLTDEKTFLEAFQKTVGDSKKAGGGNLSIIGGIKRHQ